MEWDPTTNEYIADVGPDVDGDAADMIETKIEPGASDDDAPSQPVLGIPQAMLDRISAAVQERVIKSIAQIAIQRPALQNGTGPSSSNDLIQRYSPYGPPNGPRVFLHDCKPSHPSTIPFVVSSGVDRFPLNISPHSYCIHPGGTSSFSCFSALCCDPDGVRQTSQKHRKRAQGPEQSEGHCGRCANRFRRTPSAHGGLDFFYNSIPFTHGITTNLSGVDRLST